MIGNKYIFHMTCSCCPEQYDVYDDDNNYKAYVRIRWGTLTVSAPSWKDGVILSMSINGDGCLSEEDNEEEIERLIEEAIDKFYDEHPEIVCTIICEKGDNIGYG